MFPNLVLSFLFTGAVPTVFNNFGPVRTNKRRSSSPIASPDKKEKIEHSYGKTPDVAENEDPSAESTPSSSNAPIISVWEGSSLDYASFLAQPAPEVPPPETLTSKLSKLYDHDDNAALRNRIADLEARVAELEEELKSKKTLEYENAAFKKYFNPDQQERIIYGLKKSKYSDKTLTEAVQSKFLMRETGYQHLRELFPGT